MPLPSFLCFRREKVGRELNGRLLGSMTSLSSVYGHRRFVLLWFLPFVVLFCGLLDSVFLLSG